MKTKALFLWVLTAALAGCVQLEEPNGPASLQDDRSHESPPNSDLIWDCLSRQMETGELSYRVTAREAMILADILEEDIDDYEIEYLTHEADTLMYILNSSNGWKLLSSDKRTQPVLAYGENGTFSIDSLNPGEALWLDELAEELYGLAHDEETVESEEEYVEEADPTWVNLAPAMASSDIYPDGEWIREKTKTYSTFHEVEPLTKTKWGQRAPWNQCCPWVSSKQRAKAGCVAIAGAQMLYYLHYLWGVPATMYTNGYCIGTPSNYQYGFSNPTAEAWDQMAKKEGDPGAFNSSILIGFVGFSVDMDYGASSSEAKTKKLNELFDDQGIYSTYKDYKPQTVFQQLDKGIPVILRANGSRTNRFLGLIYTYENGHAWIVEGYRKEYRITETVYRWYSYYERPDAEEDWEVGNPPPGKGDEKEEVEEAEDEEVEEEDENNGNPTPAALALRNGSRPIYATDQTSVVKSTELTGQFWYMNWGWNGDYHKKHYAVTGHWAEEGDTYRWKRKMLVVTGHK